MGEWVHGLIVKVRRDEAKDFFCGMAESGVVFGCNACFDELHPK